MSLIGNIVEIFSTIQGEGLLVGTRQIFIRFAGCNLNCVYCDTSGKGQVTGDESLTTVKEVLRAVETLKTYPGLHHSISLTGGEPLIQVNFAKELSRELKGKGWQLYLESNGTLYEPLQELVHLMDWIAMDFKLPSATGETCYFEQHRKFLGVVGKASVMVKMIVTRSTDSAEVVEAVNIVKEQDPARSMILQPATGPLAPASEQLWEWEALAKRSLSNVRVIPQVHKFMGWK